MHETEAPAEPWGAGPHLLFAVKLGAGATVLSLLPGLSAVSTVLGPRAVGGKVKALGWSSCQCTQMLPQPVTPPHTPLTGAPPTPHGPAHGWGDGRVGEAPNKQSSGCDGAADAGAPLRTGPSGGAAGPRRSQVSGPGRHSRSAPSLTRTCHVAPFSLQALLRLAGRLLLPGLLSKSVRKSGGSAGLCQRGQGAGTVTEPGRPTPGMQMGTFYEGMRGARSPSRNSAPEPGA